MVFSQKDANFINLHKNSIFGNLMVDEIFVPNFEAGFHPFNIDDCR